MPSNGLQTIEVPFLPGVREDVDPQAAPIGTLTRAENFRFGRLGGAYPRPGTFALAPTTDTPGEHDIEDVVERMGFVASVGDVGIVGVQGKIFGYDETHSRFRFAGQYSTCRPVAKRYGLSQGAAAAGFGSERYAIAVNSTGHVLIGAASSGTVHWTLETAAGQRVFHGLVTGTKCAAVVVGAVFYLVVQNGTTLTALPITPGTSTTLGTPTTVGTLTGAGAYWDCSSYSGTKWLLIFQSAAGTIRLDQFSGTTSAANTTWAVTGTVPVSVWGDSASSLAWVGYYNNPTVSGDVRYRAYTVGASSFSSAKGETTLTSAVNIHGPPLFGPVTFFGNAATPNGAFYVFRHSLDATSPFTTGTKFGYVTLLLSNGPFSLWHGVPISKPDSRMRVWIQLGNQATSWQTERAVLLRWYFPGNQRYHPILELSSPQTEKRSTLPAAKFDLFHAVAEGPTATFFAFPQLQQKAPSGSTADLIRLEAYEYMPAGLDPSRDVTELGVNTVVTGQPIEVWGYGFSQRDDAAAPGPNVEGGGASEIGFAYPPAVLVATQQAGGNLAAGGNYKWLFVWEWQDQYGNRHRSAPSAIHQIAALGGGNQQVAFQVTSLDWHQKQAVEQMGVDCFLVTYRTANGGDTYYREVAPGSAPAASDATDGIIDYTSGSSAVHADAVIATNEEIYTDGGVKDNALAPSCIFSCRSEDRLWLGGLWNPKILQASKLFVPEEPIQFTDALQFQVALSESCTGLAYQDGAVVQFAKNAIYLIYGDGPNDQGIGTFAQPRAICRDIGCTDYRSILETAQGVLFKHHRGYYLLPRGFGQPVFVGAPVQRQTGRLGDAYTTCLGAALYSDHQTRTARFLVAKSNNDTRVLTLDLDLTVQLGYGVWAPDTYPDQLQAIGTWPGGLLLAKRDLSSSTLFAYLERRDSADTGDGATAIQGLLETASVRPFGAAGQGSVASATLLASACDDAVTLKLRVAPEGATSASVNGSHGYSELSWMLSATPGEFYRQCAPAKQAGSSWTLRVTVDRHDLEPFNHMGPALHAITLEARPDTGARRCDEAERG